MISIVTGNSWNYFRGCWNLHDRSFVFFFFCNLRYFKINLSSTHPAEKRCKLQCIDFLLHLCILLKGPKFRPPPSSMPMTFATNVRTVFVLLPLRHNTIPTLLVRTSHETNHKYENSTQSFNIFILALLSLSLLKGIILRIIKTTRNVADLRNKYTIKNRLKQRNKIALYKRFDAMLFIHMCICVLCVYYY